MLSLADLASQYDLAALGAALEASAIHQDRCRRLAESIGVPDDCPETRRAVDAVDAHAAATAEAHRLVSHLRRFLADEGHRRTSPVPRQAARQPGALAAAIARVRRIGAHQGHAASGRPA